MQFLYLLEDLRNPVCDFLMQAITVCGEELVFMGVALLFLWCIDKKDGYYLLTIGLLGTLINQLLKVLFRIPRPWVRDPNFTIVESARAKATGYSFPSGHTQSGVGTFGGIARLTKIKWLRYLSMALCILIPLSRMYLGVHTLWDTSVSFVIALILVFALYPLIQKCAENPEWMKLLFGGLLMLSLGLVVFMELYDFPTTADITLIQHARKNAYKMLGAVLGFNVAYLLDVHWIRYEINGNFWNRLARFVFGLLATVVVLEGTDFLFKLLPGGHGIYTAKALSYFCTVLFVGAIWPMTFKYFKKWEDKLFKK